MSKADEMFEELVCEGENDTSKDYKFYLKIPPEDSNFLKSWIELKENPEFKSDYIRVRRILNEQSR